MFVIEIYQIGVLVKKNIKNRRKHDEKDTSVYRNDFCFSAHNHRSLGCSPDTTGPIKIGFMGNMSAPFSLSAKGAATMAVDEINKAGGISGRQVKLIVEDTKGEIPKAVEIYKKLVMNDRVLAVFIGEKVEMGVAGMEIGAELFPEYPHILFCTIGSGDDIWHRVRDNYKKYRFGFQTYYAISTNYLKILAPDNIDCFKNQIKIKKVAIIYEDMEWTKPLRRAFPTFPHP